MNLRRGFFLTDCGRLMSNSTNFFLLNGQRDGPACPTSPGRSIWCLRLLCVVAYTVHCQPRAAETTNEKEITMPDRPNRPAKRTAFRKTLPDWVVPILPEHIYKLLNETDVAVWMRYRTSFGTHPDSFGERIPPCHPCLADTIGVSLESVRRSIRKLLKMGLLRRRYDPDYWAVSPDDTERPNNVWGWGCSCGR